MNATVTPTSSVRVIPFVGKPKPRLKRFAVVIRKGSELIAYDGRRTEFGAKRFARFLERWVGVAQALVIDQEEHGIELHQLDTIELLD